MSNIFDILRPDELIKLKLRCLYEDYGFAMYKMSRFEEYRFYLENKNFLVNDSVITFTDLDGRLLALKPDVTLSIVKQFDGTEQKVYYSENVYRPDRNNRNFKEIEQLGLEYMGIVDERVVAEVISLAAKSLYTVSERSLIEIGHCGFLDAMFKYLGYGDGFRNEMTRLISQKNFFGIRSLCEKYDLDNKATELLVALPDLSGEASGVIKRARAYCLNDDMLDALISLETLTQNIATQSDICNIAVDLSLVGEDDYYNGVVFCGYIEGLPFRVLTGGQYDGLLKKLGKQGGAIGFALYLDTLEQLFR